MKVVIPGGSGQVGTILCRDFISKGYEVVVLSRSNTSEHPWKTVYWDGKTTGDWSSEINGADVVINLAGKNVNCRYNKKNKEKIMQSRIASTRVVGEAIKNAKNPPHTWLQASTATIYAHRFDVPNYEYTGIIGGTSDETPQRPSKWNFSIEVAKAWEKTMDEVVTPDTRKVKLRTSLVMSPDRNGIFDTMLGLVRFGLGGRVGSGEQYISWIHDQDFVAAINYLISNEEITDVINVTAPNPIPNKEFMKEFMKEFRKSWGTRIGLPATRWMLEIGAFFMRTETELILKSRRVIPAKLKKYGFNFAYPRWKEAVDELVTRWKKLN